MKVLVIYIVLNDLACLPIGLKIHMKIKESINALKSKFGILYAFLKDLLL